MSKRTDDQGEAGFAAVDAMVALTILASAMALTLEATATARRLADAGVQDDRAGVLLEYLVQAGPRGPGDWTGRSRSLDWRLEVRLQPSDPHAPALRVCQRLAAVSDPRSRRRFTLSALAFCLAPGEEAGARS